MTLWVVTGGAGFIGSNIARELVARGERVRILDDLSTGKSENLAGLLDRVELIVGSVSDPAVARRTVTGATYVLHQAALASVPRSIADPLASDEANVRGTLVMLLAARDAGVQRFVFASSSSVYGESVELPKREDMPTAPLSPYGVSKLAGEAYCRAFHNVYGMPTVALRYFNVFGPRQDPTSQYAAVVPLFIKALLDGRRPTIFGDGLQSRDFTYVRDVVEANLQACEAPNAVGEVFNVACGRQHSLLDLHQALIEIVGTRTEPEFAAPRPGDIRHSMADISKAQHLMRYKPSVSFRDGLLQTVGWYRQIA